MFPHIRPLPGNISVAFTTCPQLHPFSFVSSSTVSLGLPLFRGSLPSSQSGSLEGLFPLVNQSLEKGEFPSLLKLSHVRPRLKKDNLDKEILKNYRPVANIPFLSKVIEKVVATQTYNYLEAYNLMPTMQSAYRKHHSTEKTLLRVTNDILRTIDRRQDVVLVLLDSSAAFDTIDHTILVERLESYFGFSELTLCWFRSYLENRRQSIVIGDQASTPCALRYGVPQGSILGPLLFTLYIAPLHCSP